MTPGEYPANLCIENDDLNNPVVRVALTLYVLPPERLECNGPAVSFEGGIPPSWAVVDNTGSGINWTTTADAACTLSNLTSGSGAAACADSMASGVPYDTELLSNPFIIDEWNYVVLDAKAYYA